MITYKEYTKTKHKDTPKVHFGISDRNFLTEELHNDSYPDYVGSEETNPLKNGYTRRFSSIYIHPDHPDKFFTFSGSKAISHNSLQDAHDHATQLKLSELEDSDSVHISLADHYGRQNYNKENLDTISAYTRFNTLNHKLLGKDSMSDIHHALVGKLDAAMNRVKTPDSLVVYSGTSKEHSDVLRDNSVVHHPAYISTSINKRTAANFAKSKDGDVIKISIPKNHAGIYTHHMSMYPQEREFVLPRDMRLKIDHSKTQTINFSDSGRNSANLYHATPL